MTKLAQLITSTHLHFNGHYLGECALTILLLPWMVLPSPCKGCLLTFRMVMTLTGNHQGRMHRT